MGIGVPLLLVVGGLLSVQAAANVQLSRAVRSPTGAAALQLAVGSVLLLGATVLAGAGGAFGVLSGVPAWHLLGGVGSAVYITAGILLFPRLGAVVTVGLFIAGQMVASLVIDSFGLLGVSAAPPGGAALVGVFAVLAGAAVIVRSHGSVPLAVAAEARVCVGVGGSGAAVPAAAVARVRIGWLAFAVLGGAVLPVQGALNAQLSPIWTRRCRWRPSRSCWPPW